MTSSTTANEESLFDHIPPFTTFLKDVRESALKTVVDPVHLPSARKAVDVAMGTILAELNASIPSTRWVLMEYVAGAVKDDVLEEHTRPATMTVQDYWDQVSN